MDVHVQGDALWVGLVREDFDRQRVHLKVSLVLLLGHQLLLYGHHVATGRKQLQRVAVDFVLLCVVDHLSGPLLHSTFFVNTLYKYTQNSEQQFSLVKKQQLLLEQQTQKYSQTKNKKYISMILDPNDPSGLGVFSKVGRQLTQKIPILSRRKPHQHHPSHKPTHFSPVSPKLQPGRAGNTCTPFEKTVSREDRQRALSGKTRNPVVGQYNINIAQRPLMVWDYMQSYQRQVKNREGVTMRRYRQVGAKGETMRSEEKSQVSSMTGRTRKSIGHIDMDRMIGRYHQSPLRGTPTSSTTPSNFNCNPNPQVHTASPKLKGSISFKKQLSRQQATHLKTQPGLTYNCRYQYTKKNLGKVGVPFDKRVSRKALLNKTYTVSASCYDYDEHVWKGNSNIFPKTRKGLVELARQPTKFSRSVFM